MSSGNRRVVIITGAAGNLGKAVVDAFEAQGDHLVLLDRETERLSHLFPDLAGGDEHLLIGGVDLVVPEDTARAIESVMGKFSRIDVLVHTAGGYRSGKRVHETSPDEWDFMMDLNARTSLNISRAVLPAMLETGQGVIVMIGGRPGQKGVARASAYSASKSAVLRLVESMSVEYKRDGIRVNAVVPGTIDTPQNRESMPDANHEKWVAAPDVANVILFLASDRANGIYGAIVPVLGKG